MAEQLMATVIAYGVAGLLLGLAGKIWLRRTNLPSTIGRSAGAAMGRGFVVGLRKSGRLIDGKNK